MYVWARLARVALTIRSRGRYSMGGESRLSFRCLPTDIDTNIHLNNARYMMLADIGRIDIFLRAGLFRVAREKGWAPMMGGLQTVYVREIRLWRRFDVLSSIETWQGGQILGKHRFVLEDGRTAALIRTTAGVYSRPEKRFLDIDEVVSALGHEVVPRPPTADEALFLDSHKRLREVAKGAG